MVSQNYLLLVRPVMPASDQVVETEDDGNGFHPDSGGSASKE
jgi:hypothetical protein